MPVSLEEATYKQNSQTLLLFPRLMDFPFGEGRPTQGREVSVTPVRRFWTVCAWLGLGAVPVESVAVSIPECAHDQKKLWSGQ